MAFSGFTPAALDFYDDLELDNTRSFWEAHRDVYQAAVREPMQALCDALAPEFGEAKLFRPHRDVRFAKDKRPIKEHQGAYVAVGPACGWYVQIGAAGVRVGGGFYDASSEDLGRIREAIDDDRTGPALERLVAGLEGDGWEIGGDRLRTSPRGWSADHPRIELLRHKSLTAGKAYGFGPVIEGPGLVDEVRADWRAVTPLLDWVAEARRRR